jgi:uncharacterized protein (TIGR03083 family)
MTQQPLDTNSRGRIVPGPDADLLAMAAYKSLLTDISELSADDWQRSTDCDRWNVRDLVAHLVGAAQGHASMLTFMRQYTWGMRHRRAFDGSTLDAMNQHQVDDQEGRSPHTLLDQLVELAPRAVAGRSRRARLLGWAPIGVEEAGSWSEGTPTKTTMANLCAVVLTRDVWAHRLDLARACGRQPRLDPDVDGRIVADIVADWAHRHGQPVTLTLTGNAGGTFRFGTAGEPLTLDALDFARLMAGRRPEGSIPESHLWATKVMF